MICCNTARNRIHDLEIDIEYVFKYTVESNLKIRTVNDPNITRLHLMNDKNNRRIEIEKSGGGGGTYLSSKTLCCPVSNNQDGSEEKAIANRFDVTGKGGMEFHCMVCNDYRKIPCNHCQEGKIVCGKCGGDRHDVFREDIGIQGDIEMGNYLGDDGDGGQIFNNAGAGYGGDGAMVTCDVCLGIGEVNCHDCDGTREMSCPNCSAHLTNNHKSKSGNKITSRLKNALFVKTDVYVSPIALPIVELIQGRDSKCVQQIWRYMSNVDDDDDTDESIFHNRSKYFKKVVREKIWSQICNKHRRYGRRHDLFKECTYLDVFPIFIVKYSYQGIRQTHVVIA